MALSTQGDIWSSSANLNHHRITSLAEKAVTNQTAGCKLPWVDFVEEGGTSVDLVILICLILTLIFDIFLIAIIIAHDDLRKKRINLFMISICVSDISFALYLIIFLQPGFNKGRYADFVNETFWTCKWSKVLATFLMTAPWYNFLGLMLERLYAIKRPFDFRVSLQRHRWSRVIIICWFLALIPAIPLIFNSTIESSWENKSNCKCFYPLDDKIWMFWTCLTNFLIPSSLIFLIWAAMAHHFFVNPPMCVNSRNLKSVTIKMVCIAGLFLVTILPFCFAFASAAFTTPESTKWLDWTFFFPLLNGMIQPIVYILSFERSREILFKVICCERSKEGKRTGMALAIFQATFSLSGNIVDNEKGKPRSTLKKENNPETSKSRKISVVSQVTILSDDESET